jgi:twitching motility protein PilT
VAQLDPFIKLMFERRADVLQMAAGQPVALATRGNAQPASKASLSETQILGIVREIAPSEVAPLISPTALVSFVYHAPSGPVEVEMQPGGEGLTAILRPAGGSSSRLGASISGAVRPSGPVAAPAAQPAAGGQGNGAATAVTLGRTPDLEARAAIEALFRVMIETGASDLHLRSGEPPILRRNGELVRHDAPAVPGERLEAMLVSIMEPRDLADFRDGDADWAYELPGVARFRCNAARERLGPMAVFRVIPSEIRTADDLGLSREVQALCNLTKGLVVVTGPTGSGKSTTLAALIDLVNRTRADHILTIEDPIEFVHKSRRALVTQRQVGFHTRSFKHALRAALREDPDVILVGEMRDLETVGIAIETAETGHLVFGTLHTTTAASTIDRIIDQFPADRQAQVRVMLAESLKGVIAQTLCKKIGGGRVAAQEILLSIPAISNLIREGKTFQIPSIMQTNRKIGMVTLNDSLIDLVDKGLVEPKEAYMKAVEKSGFVAMLKAKRHDTSFLGEA